MRTIEQLLKPIIQEDINYLLNLNQKTLEYNLTIGEGLSIQENLDTIDNIRAAIKFGQGLLTQIPNAKAVQTPLQIIFQIPLNLKNDFIKIINNYILASNAVWSEVTDDLEDDDLSTQETYQYKLVWKSPITNDTSYDVVLKSKDVNFNHESVEMIQVILFGDVTSTSSFAMNDEELYLYFPDIEVNDGGGADGYAIIQGITAENESLQSTVNQTQLISERNPKKDTNGDSQSLNLTLAIQTKNELHKKLLEMYYSDTRDNSSFDIKMKRYRKSLSLIKTDINCKMSLNRYIQNGFEYIQVTLTRE
jgi:hypothetical protein